MLLVFLVCNLGIYIDLDVTMRTHVIATVRSCFSVLRQQRALLTLIEALVVSKVDYCCSVLVSVCGQLLDRL